MIRVIKRFAALAVMVAVALLSGSAWGWNAKRTLSSLETLTTPEARGNYLVQSINDAAANDWLELPDGVGSMKFPSCVIINKNLKLTFANANGLAGLYGGGVCRHFKVTGGTLELEGLLFSGGEDSDGYAGSIYITGGAVKATRCDFSVNRSICSVDSWGGAVSVNAASSGSFEAVDCAFSSNVSQSTGRDAYGGALFVAGKGRLTLTRCSLTGNKATPAAGKKSYGGALHSRASHSSTAPGVVCVNCTFDNNENAISLIESAKAVFAYCTVARNVNNSIDKGYPFTLDGSATAYVLGSVFFGNQDSAGKSASFQGMVKGSAKLYADFSIGNFEPSGSGQVSWTSRMGPIPSVFSVAPSKFFYTWSASLPTIETYYCNGMTYRFCTVKPFDGSSNFYSDKFIWHNSDWSTIGMGTASAASEVLWGSGATSSLTAVEKYDMMLNNRANATHNIPGSYCQMKCNITVHGNGGRLNNSSKSTSETVTAPYSPNGAIGVSSSTSWTNVCYHCVGFTNSYTGASAVGNAVSCLKIGVNYYTPTVGKTLYCKWERNTYTVKYNANGGSGSMSNQVMTNGVTSALRSNAFTRSGYVFLGWARSSATVTNEISNAASVKDLVKSTSNNQTINLYAVWMSKSAPVVSHYSLWTPAIQYADSGATITVTAGVRWQNGASFTINKNLTIRNPGAETNTVLVTNVGKTWMTVKSGYSLTLDGIALTTENGNHSSGGAIVNYGTLTLKNCEIYNCVLSNTSSSEENCDTTGGAVYNGSGASLVVYNCVFRGNRGTSAIGSSYGGAIYNDGGRLSIHRCTFKDNSVAVAASAENDRGGAIYSTGSAAYVVVTDTTFTGNTNAVFLTGGKIGLANCTIVGNRRSSGSYYEALGVTSVDRAVFCNLLVVGNDTAAGSGWDYSNNQVYVTTANSGDAISYGSVVGKGYTWGSSVPSGIGPSSYQYATYNPADYFELYNSTTKQPTLLSRKINGVTHYFYAIKDDPKFINRQPAYYKGEWTAFGFKGGSIGNMQVYPSYSISSSDVSALTKSNIVDQLYWNRTGNLSSERRFNLGAVANWTTRFVYNKNGGTGGSTSDSYGYTSPYGRFTPAANGFTRPGYTFGGWSTNSASTLKRLMPGTAYPYSDAFDNVKYTYYSSRNLYAQWKANTWYVKFDKNYTGATGTMSNETMTYDTAKALTANAFSRTGYTFAGWATSALGSVVYADKASVKNLTTTSGGTVTLYAKWTPITYTIAFNKNNSSASGTMSSITATYDQSYTLPLCAFTSAGYEFKEWYTSGGTIFHNGDEVMNLTTTKGGTVQLNARWFTKGTIASALGTGLAYTSTAPAWFGQTDVKLNGYSAARCATMQDGSDSDLTTTVYGRGTLSFRYKVSSEEDYDYLSFKVGGVEQKKWSGEQSGTFSYDITNSGNHIILWRYHKDDSYSEGADCAYIADVKWTPVSYTATFDGNGGSPVSQTKTYQDGVKLGSFPTTPTRAGFVFVGWFTAASGGVKVTETRYGDITESNLYAQWADAGKHTVVFSGNGASGTMAQQQFVVGVANYLQNNAFTRDGYSFVKWNTEEDGSGTDFANGAYKTFTAAGVTTLYAQWQGNDYTVTFDANGGTVTPATQDFTCGDTMGTLPTPTWAGHTFNGWKIGGVDISSTTVFTWTSAQTATAQWDDMSYTLNFDANGGTVSPSSKKIVANASLGTLPTPTWEGRTFVGWQIDGAPVSSGTIFSWTETKTAVAKWAGAIYTLTFDAAGGAVSPKSMSAVFEAAVGTLPTPTWAGHTFLGWEIDGWALTDSTVYEWAENKTAIAQWDAATYTLTFNANGGTVSPSSMGATFGAALGALPTPFKDGCTFTGWKIGSLAVTESTVFNWTANQTAVAQWAEIPPPTPTTYNIHFDGGTDTTGTPPADLTGFTASDNVTMPGAGSLAKSGYAFKGWAKTSGATTAAFTAGQSVTKTTLGATLGSTLTLYAVWQALGPTPQEISDPTTPFYDPTSPMFIPPELYQAKAQNAFAGNVQYIGWVRDASGALKGSLLIKAAKEKKKDHTSKLSVSYTPFGGKKTTIKNLSPVNPVVGGRPAVTIPGVGTVMLGDDSFASAGNTVQVGQDFTKSKNKAVKAAATSRLAGKQGSYTFALGLNGKYAGFTVTVDKKGKGKLAGVLPDGTKVSLSSQGVLGDRALAIPFVFAKKASFGLVFWVNDNGSLGISDLTAFRNAAGQVQTLTWHGVSRSHELAAGSGRMILCTIGGTSQTFSVANNKWVFPKKDANPCGWKMSYKAKDGSAKGQFTVLDSNGKKVKYTVNGAVVGHTFYGTAYNKKAGAYPVTAE